MRRWRGRRFQIALWLGLGLVAPARAADPPNGGDSKSWFNFHWASWMNEPSRPAPKKRPPPSEKPKTPAVEKPAPPKKVIGVVDRATAQREREVKVCLRRLAVCDELRRIAQETRDDALERQADQLDRQAWSIYNQHTAHLPGHSVESVADEQTLDRHLGTADAGRTRLVPATGSDRGSRAAIGEGKP